MIDSCPFPISPFLCYFMIHLSFPYPTFILHHHLSAFSLFPFLYNTTIHLLYPNFPFHITSFFSLPLFSLLILHHDPSPFPYPPSYIISWFMFLALFPLLYFFLHSWFISFFLIPLFVLNYFMIHLLCRNPPCILLDSYPFPLSPFPITSWLM